MNYSEFARSIRKPGVDILASLTPEKADLTHMAMLVSGEAGELLDAIKKYVMYDKPLDRDNVVEELGDIEYGLESIRDILGITREEILEENVKKLSKRYYKGSYSDKQAQDRADKVLDKGN